MPKIFHPPRPRAPGHSGVAGGVAAVGFQVGCTSPVPRSSSPPAPQEGSASPAPLPLLPSHGEAPGSWEPWTGLGKVQEWLGAGAAAGPGGEVGTHLPPGEGLRAWPSPRAVGGGPGRPRGHRDAHGANEPQPPPHHGHRLTSPSCEAPRSRPALLEATTTRAPQAEAPAPRPPQAGGLAGHAALLALITASVSGSFPSRLAWRKRCEVAAAAGKHLQGCRGQDAGCSGRSRSPQEQPAPLREWRHPSTGSGRVSGKSPAPEVKEAGIWRGRRWRSGQADPPCRGAGAEGREELGWRLGCPWRPGPRLPPGSLQTTLVPTGKGRGARAPTLLSWTRKLRIFMYKHVLVTPLKDVKGSCGTATPAPYTKLEHLEAAVTCSSPLPAQPRTPTPPPQKPGGSQRW